MSETVNYLRAGLEAKNLTMVKEAVAAGANLTNAIPGYSYNALYLAIDLVFKKAVEFLVQSGAEVNQEDWWYNCHTPLTLAISKNSLDIIKILIDHGADVNRVHSDGDTALTHAVRSNKLEIVEFLIQEGANINQKGWQEMTPLFWAISRNNIEAVKLLVSNGADKNLPNDNNVTAVEFAKQSQNKEILDYLKFEERAAKYEGQSTKKNVRIASTTGFSEDLHVVDATGNTPLMNAIEDGNLDMAEELLLAGADPCRPGANGKTPLQTCILLKDIKGIKLLLEHGAEDTIQTAFYEALVQGEMEIVKILVEKGALLNISYKTGFTPLTKSIDLGNFEIVQLLVENGANVNMPDGNGNLPLAVAVQKNYLDVVQYLIEKAKPPQNILENCTFLLKYIEEHNFKLIQNLVESGVNVNVVFQNGSTPLTKASEIQDFTIVKYLLEKGANVNQPDKSGRTALGIAASNHNLRIVKFLIQQGADVKSAKKDIDNFALANDDFAIFLDVLGGKYKAWESTPTVVQPEEEDEGEFV